MRRIALVFACATAAACGGNQAAPEQSEPADSSDDEYCAVLRSTSERQAALNSELNDALAEAPAIEFGWEDDLAEVQAEWRGETVPEFHDWELDAMRAADQLANLVETRSDAAPPELAGAYHDLLTYYRAVADGDTLTGEGMARPPGYDAAMDARQAVRADTESRCL